MAIQETARINVFINGRQAGKAIGELRGQSLRLNNEIHKLTPGTDAYIRKSRELKQVNSQLAKHRAAVRGVGRGYGILRGQLGGLRGLIISTFAVSAVKNFAESTVGAFREQERAINKVDQALESTGNTAGFTLNQLEKEAADLQKNTIFGDEQILNDATAQLLTFTNITDENFKRTQVAALNVATVLDGDLKSASIQLGKALNDPVANLSALSRSGIQFSDQQKEQIKLLAESGRLYEAQTIILDELETQYGGQAEAAAKGTGKLEQFKNMVGDAKERLGELIVDGLQKLLPLGIWLVDNLPTIAKGVGIVAAAFVGYKAAVLAGNVVMKGYQAITKGAAVVQALFAGNLKKATAGMRLFNKTVGVSPLGLLVGIATAAAGAFFAFGDGAEHAQTRAERLTEATDEQMASLSKERVELEKNMAVARDKTKTDEEREQALKQVNSVLGDYVEALTLETINTQAADDALKQYVSTMRVRADLQARQVLLEEDTVRMQRIRRALEDENQQSILELSGLTKEAIDDLKGFNEVADGALDQEVTARTFKLHQELIKLESRRTEELETILELENQVASATSRSSEDQVESSARTVQAIREEIKAEKEKLEQVTSQAQAGAIQQRIKLLEKELNAILGIETAGQKSAKKVTDSLLKELEDLQKNVDKFEFQAKIKLLSDEEAEKAEIAAKFDQQIAKAQELSQAEGEIGKEAARQLVILEELKQQEISAVTEKFAKQRADKQIELDQKSLDAALTMTIESAQAITNEKLRAQFEQLIAQRDAELANTELTEKERQLIIQRTAQNIARIRQDVENRAAQAKIQLDILTAEEGSQAQLDALVNQKLLEREIQLQNEQLTQEERQLIVAQSEQAIDDLKADFATRQTARQRELNDIAIDLFQNGLQAFREFNSLFAAEEESRAQAKQEAELARLQEQLDQKKISEEEFQKLRTDLEGKTSAEISDIKRQQAISDKRIRIFESIINTAVAVTRALATSGPVGAAAAGVAGAIQTALIVAKPIPQFYKGGKTKVKGADDGRTYNAKWYNGPGGLLPSGPQLLLANERGPEYFVPNPLMRNPAVANAVGLIEAIRVGRQFVAGGFTKDPETTSGSQPGFRESASDGRLTNAIEELTGILKVMRSNGIPAVVTNKTVEDISEVMDEQASIRGN